MRLLCISDIHGKNDTLPALIRKEARGTDVIIVSGDITQVGGYAEAEEIVSPILESGIRFFAVHGNMDRDGVLKFLVEKGASLHGKTISLGDISITGLGGGNATPFSTPTEYGENLISSILEGSAPGIHTNLMKVLVSHTPPIDTMLDRLKNGTHVGSLAIKKFIIKERFDLFICGHIHESMGEDKIEQCMCVNTGAYKDGNYCVISLDPCIQKSTIEWRKVKDL
jgi:Icc-related predicted phosphoesterase